MKLFEKKIEVYCSKGKKAEWEQINAQLESSGIRTFPSSYSEEVRSVPPCCSIDKPNGDRSKNVYLIRVHQADLENANKIIRKLLPEYSPYRSR